MCEEIESPKRKMIRVESEETQDYVREAKSAEQEEMEERRFTPSAVSVPQKLLFCCDNQCSEKTLSCWQLASVVVHEGDEAYTTNLCQKCFNKHLQAKRRKTHCQTCNGGRWWKRRRTVEGRMWNMMGKEPYVRGMWKYFSPRKKQSKEVFESWLKKKSRQEYKVSGSWNHQPENTWSK